MSRQLRTTSVTSPNFSWVDFVSFTDAEETLPMLEISAVISGSHSAVSSGFSGISSRARHDYINGNERVCQLGFWGYLAKSAPRMTTMSAFAAVSPEGIEEETLPPKRLAICVATEPCFLETSIT
jgi:hypothetical protein